MPDLAKLERLAEETEALISKPDARLWITVETGTDEAGIVGTSDAYMRLAVAALKLAGAAGRIEGPKQEVAGFEMPISVDFSDVFGPVDMRITCGWLAPSGSAVTAVRRFFGDCYEATDGPDADRE